MALLIPCMKMILRADPNLCRDVAVLRLYIWIHTSIQQRQNYLCKKLIKVVDLQFRFQVLKCRKRIHAHDVGEHGRQSAPMPQHLRQTPA